MQNWKFTRLFKPNTDITREDLILLACEMSNQNDNHNGIPAGYTYFGQFLAHDLTELRQKSETSPPVEVKKLRQARKPVLDLDSLYGGGLDDSVVPYKKKSGKFVLGKTEGGTKRDLFRLNDGTPLIADARNDENLLVAQMHVLFMRFHNKLIDYYRCLPGGRLLSVNKLFNKARKEAIRSYQWISIHDFGKRILPEKIYQHIIQNKRGKLVSRCRRYPVISIEFAGAAFRFGHSMIRDGYQVSSIDQKSVSLEQLFLYTGAGGICEGSLLPQSMIANWNLFFEFRYYAEWGLKDDVRALNQAKRIDSSISMQMQSMKKHCSAENIIRLNLKRGYDLQLASGQHVFQKLFKNYPQVADDVGLKLLTQSELFQNLPRDSALRNQTPLWAYILSEATQYSVNNRDEKSKLGVLGGWLVADGLMAAMHYSDVQFTKNWSPRASAINQTLAWRKPRRLHDTLTLEDLIVFTESDRN